MSQPITRENFDEWMIPVYAPAPFIPVRGEGSRLWDQQGKEYIDFAGGIAVNALGHAHPELREALNEQASKFWHTGNGYTNEPVLRLAKKLIDATFADRVFFCNSGAEANEGMIKLARKYSFDKYGEGRNKIITLKQSFHGRTVTTLKATGQDKFHQYFFPFTEGFDYAAANDIEDMKRKIDGTTCAVMMEMIQGEGGVLPLDKEFVQATAEFCKEKDILLLIDEVQTGIGRTGSLFCYEQYGVQPNIISMAKGLGGGVPIGAVMADKKCQDVLGAGTHGTTFGGNPLCCAAANTVLDIVNKPEFLKSVQEKGEYLKKEILAIGSPKVKTVRGMGLMLGIVVDKDERAAMVSQLMEKGVLVLTAGTEAIRLLPPLVITKEEMDEAIAAMREVF